MRRLGFVTVIARGEWRQARRRPPVGLMDFALSVTSLGFVTFIARGESGQGRRRPPVGIMDFALSVWLGLGVATTRNLTGFIPQVKLIS